MPSGIYPRSEEHKRKISENNKKLGLIPPSQKGKKRSPETIEKLRKSKLGKSSSKKGKIYPNLRGENCYKWKGGVSKNYKTGYYSTEYKTWRESVFIRDNFACQECGEMGYITAHHIKSFAQYPELRFDINNGITLCELCHSRTDNYKRKITNNIKEK